MISCMSNNATRDRCEQDESKNRTDMKSKDLLELSVESIRWPSLLQRVVHPHRLYGVQDPAIS